MSLIGATSGRRGSRPRITGMITVPGHGHWAKSARDRSGLTRAGRRARISEAGPSRAVARRLTRSDHLKRAREVE